MVSDQELFVVTGGTSGIGSAIASRAPLGSQLVVISRRLPRELPPGAAHIQADLSDPVGTNAVLTRLRNLNSPVRALVNCAGEIYSGENISDVKDQTLTKSMQLHAFSPLLLATGLGPQLVRSAAPSIVNIGSVYGAIADVDIAAYAIAKSTLPLITLLLAKAFGPKVTVNCISPGHINTAMTQAAPEDFLKAVLDHTPSRRLGTTEEVADLVEFLISDRARFITGATIRIDGGWVGTP